MSRYSKGYVAFYLISAALMNLFSGFLIWGWIAGQPTTATPEQLAGGALFGAVMLICGVCGPIYYFITGEIPIGAYHE